MAPNGPGTSQRCTRLQVPLRRRVDGHTAGTGEAGVDTTTDCGADEAGTAPTGRTRTERTALLPIDVFAAAMTRAVIRRNRMEQAGESGRRSSCPFPGWKATARTWPVRAAADAFEPFARNDQRR